jgi:hypothetical protein
MLLRAIHFPCIGAVYKYSEVSVRSVQISAVRASRTSMNFYPSFLNLFSDGCQCGTRNLHTVPLFIARFLKGRHMKGRTILTDVNQTTFILGEGTGNAIPIQAWRFPEASRGLRLPDFMTISTRMW